jgi:hypothetical protein
MMISRPTSGDPFQTGAAHEKHECDVDHRTGRDDQRIPCLRLRNADHEGEQTPGRHVIHSGATQRHDSESGVSQVKVAKYARQHREGRDGHRDTHEQSETGKRHIAAG